jgi:hypothetical protein
MPQSDPAMKSLVTPTPSSEDFGPTEYAIIASIIGFALVCGVYVLISIFTGPAGGIGPHEDLMPLIQMMGSG